MSTPYYSYFPLLCPPHKGGGKANFKDVLQISPPLVGGVRGGEIVKFSQASKQLRLTKD